MTKQLIENPFLVKVHYAYSMSESDAVSFEVDVDLQSRKVQYYSPNPQPSWAKLTHQQCATCPLKPETHEYCPAALAITDIIEYFSEKASYSTCECTVTLPEKQIIVKDKAVQDALYPLIGLRLATSQCPVMRQFAPLARFHDPFASAFSTAFRATSNFLLRQCLLNEVPAQEVDFAALKSFYEQVNGVNQALVKRLESTNIRDATPNSIFILSLFGISMTILFDDYLSTIKELCSLGENPTQAGQDQ